MLLLVERVIDHFYAVLMRPVACRFPDGDLQYSERFKYCGLVVVRVEDINTYSANSIVEEKIGQDSLKAKPIYVLSSERQTTSRQSQRITG
jgi:hypothetical protein